ncbi:MAG: hypothetical protein ACQETH_01030 [Candidatus Rifleibacteriota bacterium]
MTSFKSLKLLGLLCLSTLFLAAPQVLLGQDLDEFGGLDDLDGDSMISDSPSGDGMNAESPSGSEDNDFGNAKMSEAEQVDALANEFKFAPDNPDKDPFKPLVQKKVVLPPVRRAKPTSKPKKSSKPKKPPIKPIKLMVSGIVGTEGDRLAVIRFENQEHTITKDQVVEGKFKVVDILSDRVVVYSNKEKRRHTFKIGGDDKGRR